MFEGKTEIGQEQVDNTAEKSREENPHYKEQSKFIPIPRIEIKRAYVISQYIRRQDLGSSRYLPELTKDEFSAKFQQAVKYAAALTEEELDNLIREEDKKRLKLYNSLDWYLGTVSADEVGVWGRAGGLPMEWTLGTLFETAQLVSNELRSKSLGGLAARAKRAIPRMQGNLDMIKQEKYLYPIIMPSATRARGRKGDLFPGFKPTVGEVDDGCMRSITMVCKGVTSFPAFIGINKV